VPAVIFTRICLHVKKGRFFSELPTDPGADNAGRFLCLWWKFTPGSVSFRTSKRSVDDLIADFEQALQNYSAPMRTEDT
jgi:hypothetical protein